MREKSNHAAVVTGGSRGIGAATALALAERGFDVAITYRNKAARAETVARDIERLGRRCLTVQGDLTNPDDVNRIARQIERWTRRLDILVLNASGGLERDLVAADPTYSWRINRDAQVAVLDALLPQYTAGGTVLFVTSHWAHLYGRVTQLPAYEPVAQSKRAGEDALRARQTELYDRGVRLLVVTGDLIEGTITPKLLERAGPGLMEERRSALGRLPSAEDMGEAIAAAATNPELSAGETVVVGGALDSLTAEAHHAS